ncbi:MAG: zinc-dependent metalloprotease [Nocardioidaceae bacterium]
MALPGDETPADGDDANRSDNPFAGTPFEHLLGGLGGGALPDLSSLMGQFQQMFSSQAGNVNWDLATSVARAEVAKHPDRSPGAADRAGLADAARLAEHWLDEATVLPAGAREVEPWSRAEWVESTRASWQQLVEPIAANVVRAMSDAMPAEVRQMAGPLIGMLGQVGGALFGQQVGQAVGELAGEVVSASDVGLPLATTSALVVSNVETFGAGLPQSAEDVRLYLTLRECAYQRLFVHVPWLKAHLFGAVEEFGRGTRIDVGAIESQLSGLDPSDPQKIQDALSGGLFEPEQTPEQRAALARLETLLALVEGWVDDVVTSATRDRMPSAVPLREAVRRRRAAGGPAEQTFASLVGLELRPRRLRDAANLWAALRDARGTAGRDAVWAHPDLLPTQADLDDPMGFARPDTNALEEATSGEFDAALEALLDEDAASGDAGTDKDGDGPPGSS